jgi:hypothetical protein
MQKVEGSNPFSRFEKGRHLQVFFEPAVGWCVAPPGTQWAPGGQHLAANQPGYALYSDMFSRAAGPRSRHQRLLRLPGPWRRRLQGWVSG